MTTAMAKPAENGDAAASLAAGEGVGIPAAKM